MKKSEEIRRKTWRMIAKNLIVLAALAVAAVVGAMSWFINNTRATAEGMMVQADVPKGLEIAVVAPGKVPTDADYQDGIITISRSLKKEGTNDLLFPFLKDLSFCEVTGDGETFQKPILTQANGIASPMLDSEDDWPAAEANVDFLSFDLYMRCKGSLTVKLSSDSTLAPVDNLTSGEGYSKDSVIGAVRLSMLDSSDDKELVWLPAPHVFYDGDYRSDNYNTVILNSPDTSVTWKHFYYDDTRTEQSYDSDDSFFTASATSDFKLGKTVQMATLTKQSLQDEYYVNHVRINVWVEGEDSEARLAMVDGRFKLHLLLETE